MTSPKRIAVIAKWEAMKFGMFIHFGMNTFVNGNDLDDLNHQRQHTILLN